jgi:hypothetical protein
VFTVSKKNPGFIPTLLAQLGYMQKTEEIVPAYMREPGASPRDQSFDYIKLGERMAHSWVAQEVIRALTQDFMKSGYKIEPRFLKKCPSCGEESMDKDIKKCPVCSSKKLVDPDRGQRKKLIAFLEKPNSQRRTFRDVLYSIIYNDLVYDVWYIAIENGKISIDGEEMLVPKEMRVLDARYIKPVVDEYSRFSSNEYFCPHCWDYKNQNSISDKPGVCSLCGYELKPTAYVQVIDNTIVARWYLEQVVSGSTYSFMPGIFGEPRGKSLWNILLTMESMDQWFLDTFNDGRLDKLVNFPNYDQTKLTELTRKIQTEAAKLQVYDTRTQGYRTKKSLRTMFIASQDPITVHDVGISPSDVQLLEYYAMCIGAFCGVYGVQAIYISNLERGKSGTTPAMQIEVQNKTIEDMQNEKEISLNSQLLPVIGVTDWMISFVTPEKKDKKRDADTSFVVAQTAEKLQNAGFEIWFDEFGTLKWSDKPTETPVSRIPKPGPFGGGKAPPKEKISEATGQYTNATSTERAPHGTRPQTDQDEEREKK